MKNREIKQFREATKSMDGAGVKLFRIFHRDEVLNLDPFLLLDTFDSSNPDDYTNGFPMHPHRGIETFTYLLEGQITHTDSLGNKGDIKTGEYQWMRSGSGIMHEEMPQPAAKMQGFQLWINMPRTEKMSTPDYMEGNAQNIPVIEKEGYTLKLLSGRFEDEEKPSHMHVASDIFDIEFEPNTSIQLKTNAEYSAMVYMFSGAGSVAGKKMPDKSVATLTDGDCVMLESGENPMRVFYFAGKPLNEPIAWGGSIVMNIQEELNTARRELADGSFIKDTNIKI